MGRSPFLAAVLVLCVAATALAAVTPEQRKELAEISKSVGEASKLIRKKDLDEAEKLVKEAESRLDAALSGNPALKNERLVGTIRKNIQLRERAIALQRGQKPQDLGVSFSEDVAPIVSERCLGCHGGNNPRGGLRLDTFAGWRRGGASRRPLVSQLLARLTVPGPQRMPRGQEPLAAAEIETVGKWLQEGAKFDGTGDDAPIGEQAESAEDKPTAAKPEGGETVSFVKEVAPFMVNICGRCHAGNNPRGGFNMATFEGVMKGGESGEVIEPGDPEASRLWLMVSNKEQPRMPPGQLLLTRANYDSLTTWIKEGAKFDGRDPKRPLRDQIPSAGEMRGQELAKLSPEEFVAHRVEKSEAQWKKAFPKERSAHVETEQFLVYGNVSADRLKQVAGWADEQATTLRSTFSAKEDPLWKGKLTVFVAKERFDYEEFSLTVNDRAAVPAVVHGHAIVTPDFDDAYVVAEDIGDEPSATSPGLKSSLTNLLTQAYLSRGDSKLPDWAVQGTGLHVAAKAAEGNPYFAQLRSGVAESIKSVANPERIFADGTFPPEEADSVAFALVDYLVQSGGPAKYPQFLGRLAASGDVATAVEAVYRTTPAALAVGFAQSAAKRRGR